MLVLRSPHAIARGVQRRCCSSPSDIERLLSIAFAASPSVDSSTWRLEESADALQTLDRSQPVLLKGAAVRWCAGQDWELEAFLEKFGHLEFKLRQCQSLHEYAFTSPWERVVSVRKYFEDEREPTAVLFENNYVESSTHRALWAGSAIPPVLREVHADPIFSAARKNTYIGFHRHQESWLAHLKGRKAWWLAPPDREIPPIHKPWEYVVQRPEGVALCIGEPGDILFLPEGWWHATWNLDDFVLGLGWEGGPSANWHAGFRAVADGELESLLKWKEEASSDSVPTASWEMLHLAARAGHSDVLRQVLDWHDASDEKFPAAVAAGAAASGQVGSLQQLSLHGAVLHPWTLHAAALCGHSDVVAWLLGQRANAQARDRLAATEWMPDNAWQQGHEWTPLHTAAWNGHDGIVRQLLQATADPAAVVHPCSGEEPLPRVPQGRPGTGTELATPLHLAACRGHVRVIEALLEDVPLCMHHRDIGGATPLHRAAQTGRLDVTQALLRARADLQAEAQGVGSGWTPAAIAEASGHSALAEFLQQALQDRGDVGNSKDTCVCS